MPGKPAVEEMNSASPAMTRTLKDAGSSPRVATRSRRTICFLAIGGTAGDVRPLVALGLALRARGFELLFVADAEYQHLALSAGITASEWFSFTEIPQGFKMRTTAGQRWLWGQLPRIRDYWIWQEVNRETARRLKSLWDLVARSYQSKIIAVVACISSRTMLHRFGPYCAKIISCPMPYQPSKHFTLAAPDLSLLGKLRERRRERQMQSQWFCEGLFHLVSASPSVFPRPDDWLPNMQVTGYIPFDHDSVESSPPPRLLEFLKGGSPPVYIGFGSLAMFFGARGERLARRIIDGCRRVKARCVIQSTDLPSSFESADVFVLNKGVSHAWLFPRCAAVVHHGGYGTTNTAVIARRPMIIYPFHTDEFLWAARMGDLGLGPGFTARLRHISSDRVEKDLAFVLARQRQANADRLGSAVQREEGLKVQIAAIESIVEHTFRGLRPLDWQMPRPV
jgi:UDP:flavonoid glycosyltransferase YjiC (YdhE family)